MSRPDNINKTFELNGQSCDEIAELIDGFCMEAGAESKDVIRYRLSAEECLLYWLDKGFEGSRVMLSAGRYMFSNFFSISIDVDAGNPYLDKNDLFGSYCDSILVSLHLNPEYSVKNGESRVRFRVKKKQMGQITMLLHTLIDISAGMGMIDKDKLRS